MLRSNQCSRRHEREILSAKYVHFQYSYNLKKINSSWIISEFFHLSTAVVFTSPTYWLRVCCWTIILIWYILFVWEATLTNFDSARRTMVEPDFTRRLGPSMELPTDDRFLQTFKHLPLSFPLNKIPLHYTVKRCFWASGGDTHRVKYSI